jgi:hypothetical protein
MNHLLALAPFSRQLPMLATAGARAVNRFWEFFAANIRNPRRGGAGSDLMNGRIQRWPTSRVATTSPADDFSE